MVMRALDNKKDIIEGWVDVLFALLKSELSLFLYRYENPVSEETGEGGTNPACTTRELQNASWALAVSVNKPTSHTWVIHLRVVRKIT